mgnify:CR=1 FL=1
MVEILGVMFILWIGSEAVKSFKERAKEEGYTKIDYVAFGFILVAIILSAIRIFGLIANAFSNFSFN